MGVVIDDFASGTLEGAVAALVQLARDAAVKDRCREVAQRHFSVERGSERYSFLYPELARHAA